MCNVPVFRTYFLVETNLVFILKIMDAFPEVDLYWILIGKGSFPSAQIKNEKTEKVTEKITVAPTPTLDSSFENNMFSKINETEEEITTTNKELNTLENKPLLSNEKVLKNCNFYSNGKFVSYCP